MVSAAALKESEIRLLDRKTGRNYATAEGTAVVQASSRRGWRSPLVFEVHRMVPHEYDEHVVVGHQLMINIGGPVRLGWREESRRHEAMLRPGGLCIQSDGDANAPHWRDTMTFATAAIPPSMVDDALLDRAPVPSATFVKRHCVCDPHAYALVDALVRELGSPTEPLYAETLSHAFVLDLLGRHGQATHRPLAPKGKLRPVQLRKAVELIHAELSSTLSLRRLAALSGDSPFQFSRLFKATTGLAPHAFVLRMRLQRAYRLLREGKLSLADTALATGFYDQAHLTNVFRRAFGLTPKAFADAHTSPMRRAAAPAIGVAKKEALA